MKSRYLCINIFICVSLFSFAQDTVTRKVSDYIRFNIQLGAMVNNAYSNKIRKEPELSHTSSEIYSGHNKYKYNSSINIGCNFIFGNNRFIKHIIGVNYLRSKGEYDYHSSGVSSDAQGYSFYSVNTHYKSTIDFINVLSGFHLTFAKRIKLELCGSLNLVASGFNTITGTEEKSYNYNTSYPKGKQPINSKENASDVILYDISFCPKLSYEFNFKKQKVEAYFSYNFAGSYNLPWYMFGVAYYPFKKLR